MSKAQRQIRQTNINKPDAVGHQIEHTETVDDNLLPEASEIAKLYEMDPTILDWLKCRAEKEQDFRHKFSHDRASIIRRNENNTRILNVLGMTFAFIIFLGGMAFSYYLIEKGQTITGTVFTGFTLLAAAALFITRKSNAVKQNRPSQTQPPSQRSN